ncbi:MAG: glycosyltransferase family 2 protein [Ferruginibacter sp.]
MHYLKIFFWVFLSLVFYSYIGYAIFIWVYTKFKGSAEKKNLPVDDDFEPLITLIVATYNEEDVIERKIRDCLLLNYPVNKLKLVFVADGSTDRTVEIIKKYPVIELLYKEEREGKVAAINRAMTVIKTDYVIFCDANTFLNQDCIKEIIKHYKDSNIGAVAGEKKVISTSQEINTAGAGEGLYWRYESFLKKLDSDFYSVVGAAGELFSVRTVLYEPVASNILLDDFIISMNICKKGYKVVYEPKAYAQEAPSLNMKDERKRKIRISAGGFQSIILLKELLNIFKYGKLSFLYISHRVLRWVLCPVLLPLIFILNFYIIWVEQAPIYVWLFFLQLIFYIFSFIGWLFSERNIKVNLFYVPYYFTFMNVALYIGFKRFLDNKQTVLWDKASRKKI